MSFSLNQAAINTAIAAALPALLKELEFDYVSGRAPKGLQASVTVTEPMIRKALERYARSTVNSQFTHFGIEFQATRGEDGIIANITASTAPIQPSEDEPKAEAPKAQAAAEQPSTEEVSQEAEHVEATTEEVRDEDPVTDAGEQAEVSQETKADTAAPAPARSKLFGDLKRPNND